MNAVGVSVLALEDAKTPAVSIKDVMSEFNLEYGLRLRGAMIQVKDIIARNNTWSGIHIAGEDKDFPTKVKFEGTVSSYKNANGISVDEGRGNGPYYYAEAIFEGELNTYLNPTGLYVGKEVNMKDATYVQGFIVKKGGSFNSCQNRKSDLLVFGQVNFIDENTDGYTCGLIHTKLISDLPTCVACPACDAPQPLKMTSSAHPLKASSAPKPPPPKTSAAPKSLKTSFTPKVMKTTSALEAPAAPSTPEATPNPTRAPSTPPTASVQTPELTTPAPFPAAASSPTNEPATPPTVPAPTPLL